MKRKRMKEIVVFSDEGDCRIFILFLECFLFLESCLGGLVKFRRG